MSSSPDGLPSKQRHLVVFVLLIGGLSIALYWIDLLVVEALESADLTASWKRHASIIRSILENLIAGAIAAILLALTYRWVVALIDPGDRVIEVAPGAITERLLRNAGRTRSYVFIGNTGSFVSAAVLPVIIDSARSSGLPKSALLFLVDPTDTTAVASYVAYKDRVLRAASRVADQGLAMWVPAVANRQAETPDEVVAKVLATIYLAAFAALPSGVSVAVYLRRSFTPFRADISDNEVILTQESAAEAAVAFSSRGHFYGWYQKEADALKGQATAIDLTAIRDQLRLLPLVHPSASLEEVEAGLRALANSLDPLKSLATSPAILERAAKLVSRPTHAYR